MSKERGEFWDLSEITPKKRKTYASFSFDTDTEAADISFGTDKDKKTYKIPDKKTALKREAESQPSVIREYCPKNGLILNVKVLRWPVEYDFYNRFLYDAEKYYRVKCSEAPYVPFFSYLPQYNQMNIDQLRYYLYWRYQVSHGIYAKTDYSYIFLYCYELINLESVSTPEKRLDALCALLSGYRDKFKSLDRYLGEWICDFCLVHELPPPCGLLSDALEEIMSVVNLREFYIDNKENVHGVALRSFIIKNNTYKYESSSAYTELSKPYFDKHIINSVIYTLEKTENIKDGEPDLSKTKLIRSAYSGALCVSSAKCKIEIEYLSVNRTYRFRGMITPLVKCAENNIRAALGIRSKLSIAGLPKEVADIMKEYFDKNLSSAITKNTRRSKKREDDIRYELYDTVSTGLNPSFAKELESSSWELTKRLVDEEETAEEEQPVYEPPADTEPGGDEEDPYIKLVKTLDTAAAEVLKMLAGGSDPSDFCRKHGLMADAVYSDINELAYEYTSDVIIENGSIIEDYESDIKAAVSAVFSDNT